MAVKTKTTQEVRLRRRRTRQEGDEVEAAKAVEVVTTNNAEALIARKTFLIPIVAVKRSMYLQIVRSRTLKTTPSRKKLRWS